MEKEAMNAHKYMQSSFSHSHSITDHAACIGVFPCVKDEVIEASGPPRVNVHCSNLVVAEGPYCNVHSNDVGGPVIDMWWCCGGMPHELHMLLCTFTLVHTLLHKD